MTRFFIGLHHPCDAGRFDRCMISVNVLRDRKSDSHPNEWVLDSGAFREIGNHGRFRSRVEEYARQVQRWSRCGTMLAAVSQDFMCEPEALAPTRLTVADHPRLTIDRYDRLRQLLLEAVSLTPVLQGISRASTRRTSSSTAGACRAGSGWVSVPSGSTTPG